MNTMLEATRVFLFMFLPLITVVFAVYGVAKFIGVM